MSVWVILFLCFSPFLLVPIDAAFLLPIQKDHTTHQYVTTIYMRTPLQPIKLVLDLGASFTWVDCYTNYTSSAYHHIPCGTPLCDSFNSLACGNCYQPSGPACANNTCQFFPENSVTREANLQASIIDTLGLSIPTQQMAVFENYIFSCAHTALLKGLAKGVSGMAALGRSNISLQSQVNAAFSTPSCFAICLSGSREIPGVGIIGSRGGNIDLSSSLNYTPLILNPVSGTIITYVNVPSAEYFIGLTSIKVNGKVVPLNQTLLAINNENGFGGTKISTVVPYITLQTSIYKAFTDSFVKELIAMNISLTKAEEPFSFCYEAEDIVSSREGPGVPVIDLVMGNENVYWRMFGANSMVKVARKGVDVWCLGFLDGGANPRTSIVIGGYQMEDHFLLFDLESKRLGFSSSLLSKGTTCSNLNFTSVS